MCIIIIKNTNNDDNYNDNSDNNIMMIINTIVTTIMMIIINNILYRCICIICTHIYMWNIHEHTGYFCMGGYILYKDSTTIRNWASHHWQRANHGKSVPLCVGNPWVFISTCVGESQNLGNEDVETYETRHFEASTKHSLILVCRGPSLSLLNVPRNSMV